MRARLVHDKIREDIKDFLELQLIATERRIQCALQGHDVKIKAIERMVTTRDYSMSPTEFQHYNSQRKIHEAKLEELLLQRNEFEKRTGELKHELLSLSHENVKEAAMSIRSRVGLEIGKLTTALPIYARRSEIKATVRKHQVSIILGETGSGKSSQLPQYIYEAGFGDMGTIVCTQPRKVAAMSLAKHVAQEMASPLGKLVGYQVGGVRNMTSKANVVYMTDFTLLNDCIRDPLLKKYSCIIIDEAHERTVYTDLLIAMIKKCLPARPDLRLIVTSATIDPDIFMRYFDDCPLLQVSGRMFPVEVFYQEGSIQNHMHEAVRLALKLHAREKTGDILVFLTSPADIDRACNMFNAQGCKVLPLHGRLQPADQNKIFEPVARGVRKVIFATNCAETSLTIPGIKFVIDSGLVKEKTYDGARNMESLEVRRISKSSANQRKGRAGRTDSGQCYRLYTREQFDAMDAMTTPEIFRVHLGQMLMKLMELGVDDPLSFEYVQAPHPESFNTAMTLLNRLGACTSGTLTELGMRMAKLPLEPRLARFILQAADEGIPFTATVAASLCTLAGNIFFRSGTDEEKDKADKLKIRFCDQQGDMLTMILAFREWDGIAEKGKSNWCIKNSLNAKSMRMVRDTVKEIRGVLQTELGMRVDHKFEEEDKIREILPKSLLRSFCDSLAFFSGYERAGYFLCETGRKAQLTRVQAHPSSAFRFLAKTPRWVVYSQLLTTSQSFILNLTSVKEDWVKELTSDGTIDIDIEDLRQKELQVELTGRIGISTGYRLKGPRYAMLGSLEEELRLASKDHLVFLNLNLDIGRMQMIGAHAFNKHIMRILKGKGRCPENGPQ